jgi:V8-like Glu-specific endopeptidase
MNFNRIKLVRFVTLVLCGFLIASNFSLIYPNLTGGERLNAFGEDEAPVSKDDVEYEGIASELIEEREKITESKTFPSALDDPSIKWRPIEESYDFEKIISETNIENPTQTSMFDVLNKREEATLERFYPESSGPDIVEPYIGLAPTISKEDVIGTDDRSYIGSTTSYPWRTVCKIYITAADNTHWIGSGMIIDDYHVLTAGHCAYLHDHGGWASSLEIVPGKDGSDWPYHHAYATYMRSYTGWTSSESNDHDWAMLTLDRNVGSYTGWMGRMTAGSSSSIYTDGANIAGYPGDLDGGENMYFDYDSGDGADSYNHYYWMDTAGGMSGGPVWRYESGSRYILTVHAYGRGGTDSNFGTRLNQDKFDRIYTWVGADTPPTDRPDFRDRGSAYTSVSSYNVEAGVDPLTVNCDIENVGTDPDNVYVYFYASTNTIISEYDYYLGSDYISNIAAFSWADSSWSGTVPISIPEGNYYIGWIIDKNDYDTEFDESNNIAYHPTPVHIQGYTPPTGYIEVTVRDANTYDYLPNSYVIVEDFSYTVIDTGYTDSNGLYNVTALEIGWYYITVSEEGYHDQTKSNYINWEGDDDYLTFYMQPKPYDSGYIEVRVRESGTSTPIPSVYVTVTNKSSGLLIGTGYTDSSGFYNATGLTTGDWFEVEVSKLTWTSGISSSYINWNGDDDYLYFYLEQLPRDAGYIEVRAYNATSGLNVSSAYVECTNMTSGALIDTGYTDSDGFYLISGLTTGDWFEVNVSKLGYFYEQSKQTYINWNGDDDYLNFYLSEIPPDAGYIEVTVLDSVTYLPISNALVYCYYQSNGSIHSSGYTDIDGKFTVEGLIIGWYDVRVTRLGYYGQTKSTYINWAGDDDYLTYYLQQLPIDSGYIEVNVKDDETYLPVASAYVVCRYDNGTIFKTGYTNAAGFINITGLIVGNWIIEVSKLEYKAQTKNNYINWRGDDDYLYFYLERLPPDSGYIEVTVYDSKTFLPIENALVQCYNFTTNTLIDAGYTDSSGFYNITNLYVGWHTVNVSKAGYERESLSNYINWRGDDDYLAFSLDIAVIKGNVAILRDALPWARNVTEPILVKYGISYDIFDSFDFGSVDLSNYVKVIIASDQSQEFYNRLAGNRTWFEAYVSQGGILEMHAADRGWAGGNWDALTFPGGLTKAYLYLDNVSINLDTHPLVNVPFPTEDIELDGWFYSSHGYFTAYPSLAKKVLLNAENLSRPVLLEFPYGKGFIIATMQTLEWNQYFNYTSILENFILYEPKDNAPPIVSLSYTPDYAPNYIFGSTSFTINADDGEGWGVANITYRVNGGSWILYSSPFNLNSFATGSYTIEYTATDNLGNMGTIQDVQVILDKEAPTSQISYTPYSTPKNVLNSTLFTLTSNDGGGIGVETIYYRIDGGSWITYTGSFTLDGLSLGNHTIDYYAEDYMGQAETVKSETVTLVTPSVTVPPGIPGMPVLLILIFSTISIIATTLKLKKNKNQ